MNIDYKALLDTVITEVKKDLQSAPQFLADLSAMLDAAIKDPTLLPTLEKLVPGIKGADAAVLTEVKVIVDFLSKLVSVLGPNMTGSISRIITFLSTLFQKPAGA